MSPGPSSSFNGWRSASLPYTNSRRSSIASITSAYVRRLVRNNSNDGTFALVQITSLLYGFVGGFDRVKEVLNEIYNGIYQNQISANRDQ